MAAFGPNLPDMAALAPAYQVRTLRNRLVVLKHSGANLSPSAATSHELTDTSDSCQPVRLLLDSRGSLAIHRLGWNQLHKRDELPHGKSTGLTVVSVLAEPEAICSRKSWQPLLC